MNEITVIGTGYVGLVAAIGLADFGNRVIGADIDPEKVDILRKGISPIYETGIDEYLRRNIASGRLSFTTDIPTAIKKAAVVILAVGTPAGGDGAADLTALETAADTVADNATGYTVVVIKSTVPVGTNRRLLERLRARAKNAEIDIISNPEFLREGRAIQDFFHPDRTVVGYESERARKAIEETYRSLNLISVPFVWCELETAELIKYASNAFLATKISYINQMANLADAVGADIHVVAKTMGMDGRISPKFLHPGPGYGGSCFPKDVKAIINTGEKYGVDMGVIRAVSKANDFQKSKIVDTLREMIGDLSGKTVTLLGLAFKQETDDVRESPAITVALRLLAAGVSLRTHDPKAADNFRRMVPEARSFKDSYSALEGADAVILMTEWNEYRSLDLDLVRERMRKPVLLDTRNLLDPGKAQDAGFLYRGTGRR